MKADTVSSFVEGESSISRCVNAFFPCKERGQVPAGNFIITAIIFLFDPFLITYVYNLDLISDNNDFDVEFIMPSLWNIKFKQLWFTVHFILGHYSESKVFSLLVNTEPAQVNTRYLTWQRTMSARFVSSMNTAAQNTRDDALASSISDIYCMRSGSHASTLDRLYAWEKKLYDEVKVRRNSNLLHVSCCLLGIWHPY